MLLVIVHGSQNGSNDVACLLNIAVSFERGLTPQPVTCVSMDDV